MVTKEKHNLVKKILPPRWILLILGVVIALIAVGQLLGIPLSELKSTASSLQNNFGWKTVLVGGLIYAILLSIPFFPGVELAWMIIFFFGKDAVVLIYLYTLLGLSLSFVAGRNLNIICPPCSDKLKSVEDKYHEKFNSLAEKIHRVFSSKTCNLYFNCLLKKIHYLVLGILINIPGNSVLGGGGGIALLSGMNRSFSWRGFLITICVAIAPLPIFLYFGILQIENLVSY
jgi:hypothetical protein